MDSLVKELSVSAVARFFVIAVMLDIVIGVLRSIKYKEFNSSFGIDGAIRKCAMIVCVLFLAEVDIIFKFNLISYVPEEVTSFLGLSSVGISELFTLIFIACECVSILKNLLLCGVPIPAKAYTAIASVLDTWTDELTDFKLIEMVDSRGKKHTQILTKKKRE